MTDGLVLSAGSFIRSSGSTAHTFGVCDFVSGVSDYSRLLYGIGIRATTRQRLR